MFLAGLRKLSGVCLVTEVIYLTFGFPLSNDRIRGAQAERSVSMRGGFYPPGVGTAGHQTSPAGETCWKD